MSLFAPSLLLFAGLPHLNRQRHQHLYILTPTSALPQLNQFTLLWLGRGCFGFFFVDVGQRLLVVIRVWKLVSSCAILEVIANSSGGTAT